MYQEIKYPNGVTVGFQSKAEYLNERPYTKIVVSYGNSRSVFSSIEKAKEYFNTLCYDISVEKAKEDAEAKAIEETKALWERMIADEG